MKIIQDNIKLQKRRVRNTHGKRTGSIVTQIQIPKPIIEGSNMNIKGLKLRISLQSGGRKIVIEKAE
jgi:hypothetical protein